MPLAAERSSVLAAHGGSVMISNLNDLHGAKEPQFEVQSERAWHMLAIFLAAQGMAQNEIARRLNHDQGWVSQVLRQPWARERLVAEIRGAGKDEIATILRGAVTDSLLKLVELRDTAESEQVQATCADKILDRFLGKPTQHVETKLQTSFDADSVEKLDAKITELENEEARLTGREAKPRPSVPSSEASVDHHPNVDPAVQVDGVVTLNN